MKLLNLLLIMGLLTLVACSSGDKEESGDDDMAETALEDSDDGDEDFIVDSDEDVEEGDEPEMASTTEDYTFEGTGDFANYTVEKGDTLMLIAFKLYGDYTKWRALQSLNNGINPRQVSSGMNIKYEVPSQKFVWNPQGEPHLIQGSETLGTISTDKYGTKARWKDLWTNNRPMIKDPNLIFAGFTLYYIPDDRSVASE